MRTGLIAEKVGMSRILTEQGEHIPVTLLKVDNCQVVAVQTQDKNGYSAVQLGCGVAKVKNISKPLRGHYAKAQVEPKMKLAEFRVAEDALLQVGDELSADHFIVGQMVDVVGNTIGRGFAGPMKRHNFGGLRATHGVSVVHRSHGSTGQRQDPGKVFKNKKMAGHMGCVRVTTQNLEVVMTDADQGLILVRGNVPGAEGSYVYISDAVKEAPEKGKVPYPAALKQKASAAAAAPAQEAPAAPSETQEVSEGNVE